MTKYISKRDRLINAMRGGKKMTVTQMVSKFNFASRNSAYGVISMLRQEGWDIKATPNRNGINVYGF